MKRTILAALLAVLLVGLGAVPASASTHTLKGTFTLTGTVFTLSGNRATDITADLSGEIVVLRGVCSDVNGYDDLAGGTAVVVRNASGRTIATSALRAGKPGADACVFAFSAKVPDASFYAVEVSHRGQVTFSRKQLERRHWKVAISLT